MELLAHRLERLGTRTAFSIDQAAAAWKAKGNPAFPFSLYCPYRPATQHLIGHEQPAAMKNSAYLASATVKARTALAMLAVDDSLAVPSDEPPYAPIT